MTKKICLNDLMVFKTGNRFISQAEGYPIYGGNGINGFTNDYNYENVVIIGRVGTCCGNVFYEPRRCWVSDNAIAVTARKNTEILFIFHLLNALNLTQYISGSGQKQLTQEILKAIEVPEFDEDEQKKIVNRIDCFREKILINRQISDTCAHMAFLAYVFWFEDFNFPDVNGIDYRDGGGLMRYENILGCDIPDNWQVVPLGKVVTGIREKNSDGKIQRPVTLSAKNGLIDYYSFNNAGSDITKYTKIKKDDLVYNRSKSEGYPVGSIAMLSNHEEAVVSPLYFCFRVNDAETALFWQFYLNSNLFQMSLKKITNTGMTGNGVLNIKRKEFYKLPVLCPPKELQLQFVNKITSYISLAKQADEEIIYLTRLQEKLFWKEVDQLIK